MRPVPQPPGTGKSQVVVELLASCALAGRPVLFASKNNRAVDVVRERDDEPPNRRNPSRSARLKMPQGGDYTSLVARPLTTRSPFFPDCSRFTHHSETEPRHVPYDRLRRSPASVNWGTPDTPGWRSFGLRRYAGGPQRACSRCPPERVWAQF